MANNGPPPHMDDTAMQRLEHALRGVQSAPARPALPEEGNVETGGAGDDDVAARMQATADICRELSRYCEDFAAHLEREGKSYIANMHRLLGRIGK